MPTDSGGSRQGGEGEDPRGKSDRPPESNFQMEAIHFQPHFPIPEFKAGNSLRAMGQTPHGNGLKTRFWIYCVCRCGKGRKDTAACERVGLVADAQGPSPDDLVSQRLKPWRFCFPETKSRHSWFLGDHTPAANLS